MRLSLIQLPPFVAKWSKLKLTDDDLRSLEEVLLDPLFPSTVEGLLFAPARTSGTPVTVKKFGSWDGICAHLFGLRR